MTLLPESKVDPTLHLRAACLALLVVAGLLVGLDVYTASVTDATMPQLRVMSREQMVKAKDASMAYQRTAVSRNDTVMLYGSSELNAKTDYRAGVFFNDAPTGFYVFPIGRPGSTCLIILQELASLGPELKGKKIAISVSQPWVMEQVPIARYYDGNFHIQEASQLLFHPTLSLALKRQAAQRMLYYPHTLDKDSVAFLGAQWLAADTPVDTALYGLLLPLGWINNLVYRLQDDYETLLFVPKLEAEKVHFTSPVGGTVNWNGLAEQAQQEYRANSTSNPYGISDKMWKSEYARWLGDKRMRWIDKTFKQRIANAVEWQDLELVLRALRELGAQPMLLSMPMPQGYWQALGVSVPVQNLYYQKLAAVAQKYDIPLRDFHEFAGDLTFMSDPMGHLSPKGWVYYDQALDAFYHDTAP